MVIDINYSNRIDFKIFFIGAILASLIHLIAIPLIDLIPKRVVEEEIEPKIILELIKKMDTIKPIPEQNIIKPRIDNNIQKEQIIKEISPLPKIEKAQKLDKKYITPIPQSINQTIEDKITIPVKPRNNNINKNFTAPIPQVMNQNIENKITIPVKPKNNNLNKFITPVLPIKPNIIVEEVLKPFVLEQTSTRSGPKITSPTKQTLFLENVPIIQDNLPPLPKKVSITDDVSEINGNILNEYKESLVAKIQKFAIENYPQRSLNLGEEGTVEIIFKLKTDGNLDNIKIGTATMASERLIKAAKKAVEQNAPYDSNPILEKKNEFSILIIYKIN